uniref:Uncharacterized protein n=1 Tax=Arundo donax TaxID=35708 RepID=A0A0A9E987_ARUDO
MLKGKKIFASSFVILGNFFSQHG